MRSLMTALLIAMIAALAHAQPVLTTSKHESVKADSVTVEPMTGDPAISLAANAHGAGSNTGDLLAGEAEQVTYSTAKLIENPWINENEITTDTGDVYAYLAAPTGGRKTYYLIARDFGASVPEGARIDGVAVTIRAMRSGGTWSFGTVQLGFFGQPLEFGSNQASTQDPAGTISNSALTSYVFGGAANKWDLNLTPADVNDQNFAVYIRPSGSSSSTQFRIDWVKIKIYYSVPTATSWSMGADVSDSGAFKIGRGDVGTSPAMRIDPDTRTVEFVGLGSGSNKALKGLQSGNQKWTITEGGDIRTSGSTRVKGMVQTPQLYPDGASASIGDDTLPFYEAYISNITGGSASYTNFYGNITGNLTGNASGSAGTVMSISSHASTELSDSANIARANQDNNFSIAQTMAGLNISGGEIQLYGGGIFSAIGRSPCVLGTKISGNSATSAAGNYSLSLGYANTAGGSYSSSVGGYTNAASGDYSFAAGANSIASGYGSVAIGDTLKAGALTAGLIGGGHNEIKNKGTNIAGSNSGADGADSAIVGGAYNTIWALRSFINSSLRGNVNGDYSSMLGCQWAAISDAHDNCTLIGVENSSLTTATTSAGQIVIGNAAHPRAVTINTTPDASNTYALDVNGTVRGTTFSGSGASLTNIPAAALPNAAADGATKGVAAFNATNFSASSGVVNTIQNIGTGASPSFTGLTVSGLTSGRIPYASTGGALADTTNFQWNNAGGYADINGYMRMNNYFTANSAYASFINNGYYSSGWKYIGTNAAHQLQIGTGGLLYRGAVSGTANNAITWVEYFSVQDDGQVRIGAPSPDSSNNDFTENHIYDVSGAKLTAGGTWTNASSRKLKFLDGALSGTRALDIVTTVPIYKWEVKKLAERVLMKDGRLLTRAQARQEWKAAKNDDDATTAGSQRFVNWIEQETSGTRQVRINQRNGEKHIGPVAEEFKSATVDLGICDGESIAASDMAAVLWAAVKEQQKQIADLRARVAALEAK